jgi:transglutaminase-like putative cysteine protease
MPTSDHHATRRSAACIALLIVLLGLSACQPVAGVEVEARQMATASGTLSFVSVEPQSLPASVAAGPGGAAFTVLDSVRYAVTERLVVANDGPGAPAKQNLWVALIGSVAPYQEVHAMEIAPSGFRLFADEQGNRYAEFDLSGMPASSRAVIEIRYEVTVNELAYDLTSCTGPVPQEWIEPELHIESNNGQIRDLAAELSQGLPDGCQQLRAFYDHIGNTLTYTYNGEQWGAQAALGPMGADCTEYAALMAALSRAVGLPARYLEGVAYLTDENASLGPVSYTHLTLPTTPYV